MSFAAALGRHYQKNQTPVFDVVNELPTVIIPKGWKLSEKFTTDKEHVISVKTLLTSGDGNTKLKKNKRGFLSAHDEALDAIQIETVGLPLAPHNLSGFNTCGSSTVACRKGCLDGCGRRNVWEPMHLYKIAKTVWLFSDPLWFLQRLDAELKAKQRQIAKRDGFWKLAARLNVFSDVRWEDYLYNVTHYSGYGIAKSNIFDANPDCMFYDYTKHNHRSGWIKPNYYLTFSRSDKNQKVALRHLENGYNVAVVFASKRGKQYTRVPKTWMGYECFNANESDLRFTDPVGRKRGKVAALDLRAPTTKAYQKALETGFPVLQP